MSIYSSIFSFNSLPNLGIYETTFLAISIAFFLLRPKKEVSKFSPHSSKLNLSFNSTNISDFNNSNISSFLDTW